MGVQDEGRLPARAMAQLGHSGSPNRDAIDGAHPCLKWAPLEQQRNAQRTGSPMRRPDVGRKGHGCSEIRQ